MEIKKRGRPPIGGSPMTGLERNRKYREKLKASGSIAIQLILTKSVVEVVDGYIGVDGATRAEVVQSWLTDWAISAALGGESHYGRTIANKIVKESQQLNLDQESK